MSSLDFLINKLFEADDRVLYECTFAVGKKTSFEFDSFCCSRHAYYFYFVKKSLILAGVTFLDFSFLNQDFGNLSLIALIKFVHIN